MPFLSRRTFLALVLPLAVVACGGGAVSVLHGKGKPGGDGPALVTIDNQSGLRIERLYVAETAEVNKAKAAGVSPGTPDDLSLWGEDHFGNAGLGNAEKFETMRFPEGRYDFLLVDHDRREQLIKGLLLRSGGKYVLEVRDNWGMGR